MLRVTPSIVIEESELEERFVRASGPGGQNVNKVATAVELRFDAAQSPALTDDILQRLRTLAGARLTQDGVIVIDARRHRTQAGNRRDARERLVELLRRAASQPKRRRSTKPTASSIERRVAAKKRRAQVKRSRMKTVDD